MCVVDIYGLCQHVRHSIETTIIIVVKIAYKYNWHLKSRHIKKTFLLFQIYGISYVMLNILNHNFSGGSCVQLFKDNVFNGVLKN